MSATHYHTIDELDDLEEGALECTTSQRLEALRIAATSFNRNKLDYGLIGGTNFYLRGSDRTTTDVDIAISGHWGLADVLDMLNYNTRITRPSPDRPLLWASGVARIFVLTSHDQLVQVDLKRQTSSTHDFDVETELIPVPPPASSRQSSPIQNSSREEDEIVHVRFFKIAPLVKLKLHAYYIRESNDDYHDLKFACRDNRYGPLVKAASKDYPFEERVLFLERVLEDDPQDETIVRDVMNVEEDRLTSSAERTTASEEESNG